MSIFLSIFVNLFYHFTCILQLYSNNKNIENKKSTLCLTNTKNLVDFVPLSNKIDYSIVLFIFFQACVSKSSSFKAQMTSLSEEPSVIFRLD